MKFECYQTKKEASVAAALNAARLIKLAIKARGHATFVAATGTSQLEFLKRLIKEKINWKKTTMFHLDEYIGLKENHKASFRKYLKERFIDKVNPGIVNLIQGDACDLGKECKRLNELISKQRIDVAFLGIGEDGHLAFNEPPADFKTKKAFVVVKLNETSKKQQVKEGWFTKMSDVPSYAISMSINQIMKARNIICLAPEKRKAKAVRDCFTKKISPMNPASILRKHKNAFVYLDKGSSSLLADH